MELDRGMLGGVRHPGRYVGTEVNAILKDPVSVSCRVALAYPDLYEVAMSYLGLQVLYDLLNAQPDLWAERVFAPDVDLEAFLRTQGLPLRTLESRTSLAQFDLVGFTLQHELNYPDVLCMLDLGGIPLRAGDRTEQHPLVIAGGPGAANPEALAEALDVVFLGDAEEAFADIARIVGRGRRQKLRREAILDQLMSIPGVYLPNRYLVQYRADGTVQSIEPRLGAPAVVRRRLLLDLDQVSPPLQPIVPCIQTVHDRLTLEIQRGCTRGCRFCQAGMINRPVRCRTPQSVIRSIDASLCRTGFEQVSFLSLSAGDHPHIQEMLRGFFQRHQGDNISASLPSLRAETLTPDLIDLVRTVRKSGFTIAPEAGTERLRRVIQKNMTEQDILQATLSAFAAGWRLIKLYFMIGLPTERAEDQDAIVELVARIQRELRAARFRPHLNVGLSVFVPKPHTPFQWEAMVSPQEAMAARTRIQSGLRRVAGVKVGWSHSEMSLAEGLLSRGDRRQFAALCALAKDGQRLAAWSEHFNPQRFAKAFGELPVPGGMDFYLRRRRDDEVMPWDHLDMGPSRRFLLEERERAWSEQATPDCAQGSCYDCGACMPEGASPQLHSKVAPLETIIHAVSKTDPGLRLRLRMAKLGPAVFFSHLEFMTAIERACRRAQWPLLYHGRFHPKPKMSFGPACPVGVASEAEWVDIWLPAPVDLELLTSRLRAQLPQGITLQQAEILPPNSPGIMQQLGSIRYRLCLGGAVDFAQASEQAREFMQKKEWRVLRKNKDKVKALDLRASILDLEVHEGALGPEVVLDLNLGAQALARPLEVSQAAFGVSPMEVIRERSAGKADSKEQA